MCGDPSSCHGGRIYSGPEHQSVVAVGDMEKEVKMEFDGATRFYFIDL